MAKRLKKAQAVTPGRLHAFEAGYNRGVIIPGDFRPGSPGGSWLREKPDEIVFFPGYYFTKFIRQTSQLSMRSAYGNCEDPPDGEEGV